MSKDKKVEPETTLFRTFSIKGLELRDYFAAKAMQAMIIGNSASIAVCSRPGAIGVAKDAYIVADVMLVEREKQQ